MDSLLGIAGVGAMLGLASAMHCALMCGCISAGLLTLFAPAPSQSRTLTLAAMMAGRVTVYIALGAIVGLAGQTVFGLMTEPKLAARILQWGAAVSLMWIGLSVAGLVPATAGLAPPLRSLTSTLDNALAPLRRNRVLGPYAAGLTWGVTPCPMVYGALFTAAVTASLPAGAVLMAGFGLGTVPAVTAAALGLTTLTRLPAGRALRMSLGLAIAAFGFATVYLKLPIAALCLTP